MSPWIVSLLFSVGVSTWLYVQLVKYNGNASPQSNFIIIGILGVVIFGVMFSVLKLVLGL